MTCTGTTELFAMGMINVAEIVQCTSNTSLIHAYSDHGLCGSNKLLYKRCAFSMGGAKFRPPHNSHIFHPIFVKVETKKHIRTRTRTQNLVKIGSPGASGRTPKFWPYILGYPFYIFLYSSLSVLAAPCVVRRPLRAQTACFWPSKCLLAVLTMKSNI